MLGRGGGVFMQQKFVHLVQSKCSQCFSATHKFIMSERFFKGADKNASSKDNLCMLSYKSLQKLATELELPAKIKVRFNYN